MSIEIIFYNKDKKTNQSLKLSVPSNCFYRMTSTDESTFVVKNRTDEIVSLPRNQVFALSVGYLSSEESPTFEERLEIALYAIEHGKNYSATAKKYNVSYQQVYNWVKKYLSKGENGLKDNRGKRIENRDKAELTDTEKAELKLKEAKDRIRRLEAENFMLKKLHEFQRRSIK